MRMTVLSYYRSFHFAITLDRRSAPRQYPARVGRSRAVAPGTRRFDDALYSTCTRENVVMMVARPWRISRRESRREKRVDLRGDELKGRSEALPRAREEKKAEETETTSLASFLLALSAGNKNRRHERLTNAISETIRSRGIQLYRSGNKSDELRNMTVAKLERYFHDESKSRLAITYVILIR